MTELHAHVVYDDEDRERVLAYVHPASSESVSEVLRTGAGDPDGRSQWCWLRLPNGDLALAVFPQGETYFAVERDAAYPAEEAEYYDDGSASLAEAMSSRPPTDEELTSGSAWNQRVRDEAERRLS